MLGALAAYAFSRFRFKGRRIGMLLAAADPDVPAAAAVVAIYLIVLQHRRRLPVIGLNTLTGLILVYLGGAMGVNIWLMKGFFDTIPAELDESARVDGATPAQVFWGVILPLAAPVLAVVGALLVHRHDQRVRDRERSAADQDQLHARRSACGASSTSSTRSTGARSPPASCSRRCRSCSSSCSSRSSSSPGSPAARSRDELDRARPRHVAARASRTTTARPTTSSSSLTSSAAMRSCACACRRARATTSSCATSSTASRTGRERRSTGRRRRRRGGARRSLSGTRASRTAGCSSAPTAAGAGSTGSGVVRPRRPRRGRLRARPRPTGPRGTSRPSSTRSFPTGSLGAPTLWLRATRPDWAVAREWDEPPTGRGPNTPREWFGGDLRGIEEHLDHVASLGAGVLYLTPVFPACSTHRYDATSFDRVDPLLGGDEALRSLVDAAHARGMRVIGDLTTNHSGNGHEWFLDAREDRDVAGARALLLRRVAPGRIRVLARRCRACRSSTGARTSCGAGWPRSSAVARAAVQLDGWRIDVANMTGRYRELDLTREAAELIRRRARRRRRAGRRARLRLPPRPPRDGWHGAMNYAGFLRPVWGWLRADELPGELAARSGACPSASRVRAALRWSPRCGRSGRVCRGSRRCTRGRSSTATTAPASAPSPARASGCSSASASR